MNNRFKEKLRMIEEIDKYSYGYKISAGTTQEEWDKFMDEIRKIYEIRCIICNYRTARYFVIPLWGDNIITINNKIADNVFFVNHCF